MVCIPHLGHIFHAAIVIVSTYAISYTNKNSPCHTNDNHNGPTWNPENQSAMIESQLESKPGGEKTKEKRNSSPSKCPKRPKMDARIPSKRRETSTKKSKKPWNRPSKHRSPKTKEKEKPPTHWDQDKIKPEPKVSVVSIPASSHQSQSSPNNP